MDTDHDLTDTHEAPLERLVAQLNKPEVKEWLALRKEAGARIDPATAVVFWEVGNPIDPYGVCDDLGGWLGRVYFARSPESDVWVEFGDLPEPTRTASDMPPFAVARNPCESSTSISNRMLKL